MTDMADPLAPTRLIAPSDDERTTLLQPGALLNSSHRIEALIGRGGMGEVYRATNIHTGDQDAIKVIRRDLAGDPQIRELFRREAGALRKMRHPAVVSYQGAFGDESGRLFLVMDYVEGPSLASAISKAPLLPAEVRRLGAWIAEGLAAAHTCGVVHRDLSPDNIVLRGGDLGQAVLIDFGVAKRLDRFSTLIGDGFAGKLDYCSPEQCGLYGGVIDHRTDIYSLGLVLAAAASGKPLPMGSSLAGAVKARESRPDLSGVPDYLRRDLVRLLEPDPARRVQSMREVAALLNRGADRALPAPKEIRSLRRLAWGVGGVAVLLLMGIDLPGELPEPALDSAPPLPQTAEGEKEPRAEAEGQRPEDEAQLEAEAERRRAEDAQRKLEADKRAAELAQRRAEEARRREDERRKAGEQRPVAVSGPPLRPPGPEVTGLSQSRLADMDGAWRGTICFRRIGLTRGNETCGPMSLLVAAGTVTGNWTVHGITYGISGAIAGDGGRLTLEMPPAGRGASLGAKFTLPVRLADRAMQGQGYTISNVLVMLGASR